MFLNDQFDYNSLIDLCLDIEDEEAIEDVSIFLGKPSSEVNCEMIRMNPSAWSFFTPTAFRYYTPALIRCCNNDIYHTYLAFENFISYFDPVGCESDLKRRKSVLIGYTSEELHEIEVFIDNIKSESYDSHVRFSLIVARSVIGRRSWLNW